MNQLCFPMEDSKRKTLQKDVQVINRKMHTTLNNHGCVDDQVHTSSLFFPFVFSGITCMGGENWLSKKKAKLPLQKKKKQPGELKLCDNDRQSRPPFPVNSDCCEAKCKEVAT